MTFSFRPARRNGAKLLIGLAGPTGSGKTYSALLLASGITSETGGRIAFIDTESGRALQYAPPGDASFDFDHGMLEPPFAPGRYMEAFAAAEEHAGEHGVVIIDSVSHEHEGPGGLLEMHDAEVERLAKGRDGSDRFNFMAWSKPKAERRKLINRILQSNCHAIFCFRAKEKNKIAKTPDGKQQIVPIGWQPITGDEWPYEMTIFALLNPERKGVPVIDGFDFGKLPLNMRSLVSTEVALTQDTGSRLAKWAGNGRSKSSNGAAAAVTVWLSDDDPEHPAKDLTTAGRLLYKAVRDSIDLAELAELDANNTALVEKLPTDAKKAVGELFAKRLADLHKPDDTNGDPASVMRIGGMTNAEADELEPAEWRGEDAEQGSLV